jgi:putative transposase
VDTWQPYLTAVLDLFSGRVLGYTMSEHHDAEPAVAVLRMAPETACGKLGVLQSMGRVGSALDNAAAEALNSTIKVEYIHRSCSVPGPRREARTAEAA